MQLQSVSVLSKEEEIGCSLVIDGLFNFLQVLIPSVVPEGGGKCMFSRF